MESTRTGLLDDLVEKAETANAIVGLSQIIALLDGAATRPSSEAVQEEIYDLARNITAIRDRLEAGELEAAQAMMDRRWAWVIGD